MYNAGQFNVITFALQPKEKIHIEQKKTNCITTTILHTACTQLLSTVISGGAAQKKFKEEEKKMSKYINIEWNKY